MAKKPRIADQSPRRKWPTIFTGNEVVWEDSLHQWLTDVKEVRLEESQCVFDLMKCQKFNVTLATSSQSVELNNVPLSTTNSSQSEFALRAYLLTTECFRLCDTGECHTIQQHTRPASTAVADSDDEQVPDPAIPPAFSDDELVVLNYLYPDLWSFFQNAKASNFQNAAGKIFFAKFGEFLLKHSVSRNHLSLISTNPSGDAQPGAMEIIHTDPSRDMRHSRSQKVQIWQKRIADYVLFDTGRRMYCIVGEIKSEDTTAESQNIEQMIGLFRKNQYAMLGFTCNPGSIMPRVLIQVVTDEGVRNLRLYTLPTLSLSAKKYQDSLLDLARLFIAFTSVVNITLPECVLCSK